MTRQVAFNDGNPRVEEVDGVVTRHVAANLAEPNKTPQTLLESGWGQG